MPKNLLFVGCQCFAYFLSVYTLGMNLSGNIGSVEKLVTFYSGNEKVHSYLINITGLSIVDYSY